MYLHVALYMWDSFFVWNMCLLYQNDSRGFILSLDSSLQPFFFGSQSICIPNPGLSFIDIDVGPSFSARPDFGECLLHQLTSYTFFGRLHGSDEEVESYERVCLLSSTAFFKRFALQCTSVLLDLYLIMSIRLVPFLATFRTLETTFVP